jgi:hypothetical protein
VFENRVLWRIFGPKRDEMDEMGMVCSTKGGEGEFIYDISGKARRKETTRKIKT